MPATTAETKKIAKLMRDLDFCMFATLAESGEFYARPMSNNRKVEYDGDVWFFSGADTKKVDDIKRDPRVQLSYIDSEEFCFISLSGTAKIVKDVKKKRELWDKELERWFKDGPESDDVVLIKVTATRITYWCKDDEGDIKVK